MKKNSFQILITCSFLFLVFIAFSCSKRTVNGGQPVPVVPVTPTTYSVAIWLTDPNSSVYFNKQNIGLNFSTTTDNNPVIGVDTASTYQSIDGFGFCLTGGSASLINALPSQQQNALLKNYFNRQHAYWY